MVEDYKSGKCPRAASAMEMLADHYGIPSICFGPRVAADVAAGKLVMTIGEVETAVPPETPNRDQAIAEELAKKGQKGMGVLGESILAKEKVNPRSPLERRRG